jgi:hypothetical protein
MNASTRSSKPSTPGDSQIPGSLVIPVQVKRGFQAGGGQLRRSSLTC